MQLQLSTEQGELLRELIDEALGNLRMEIQDTDNSRFKEQLRTREELLTALIELIRTAA